MLVPAYEELVKGMGSWRLFYIDWQMRKITIIDSTYITNATSKQLLKTVVENIIRPWYIDEYLEENVPEALTVYSEETMITASGYANDFANDFNELSSQTPPKEFTGNNSGVCVCLNMEKLARSWNIYSLNRNSYDASELTMSMVRKMFR